MSGTIDVLNCKLGDLKLSFDKSNPVDADRARRAVTKMLRDGFVIFVEVDGQLRRVESFDEQHEAYIITDVPGQSAAAAVEVHVASPTEPEIKADGTGSTDPGNIDPGIEEPAKPGKRGKHKRRVPAATSRATAVAPRSGG